MLLQYLRDTAREMDILTTPHTIFDGCFLLKQKERAFLHVLNKSFFSPHLIVKLFKRFVRSEIFQQCDDVVAQAAVVGIPGFTLARVMGGLG